MSVSCFGLLFDIPLNARQIMSMAGQSSFLLERLRISSFALDKRTPSMQKRKWSRLKVEM